MYCRKTFDELLAPQSPVKPFSFRYDGEPCDLSKVPCVIEAGEGGTVIEYTGGTQTASPWYADAMNWAKERHIINDGRPNDPVTRAELAMVLYRMFGPGDEKTDSGLLSEE